MRSVNNHKVMLIGRDAATVVTAGSNFAAKVEDGTIVAGQIAVVDASGIVRTAASSVMTAYDEIYIVQSQGAGLPIIKSAAIPRPAVSGAIVKAYKKEYAAPVAQVDYIGYNASSNAGELLFTADEAILVRASLKSNFSQFADKEVHVLGDHTPTSASTQATVALALAKSLIQNSEKYVNVPFQVDRVSSGTLAAISTGINAVTFTKGSKIVTATGDFTTATGATALAAGVYLSVDGAAAVTSTDTSAVYKIVSVDSATQLTLDLAYQGASVTVTSDVSLRQITAADATAGDFGIKLTGKTRRFQEGVWRYEVNKWITTVAGMGATLVANVTVPSEGSGAYAQIAEDEWFYQLQEGMHQSALLQVPPVTMRKNVSLTGVYDTFDITVSAVSGGTDILQNPISHKAVKVVFNNYTEVVTDGTPTTHSLGAAEFADTIEEFLGLATDALTLA